MAKQYRVTPIVRFVNWIGKLLTSLGIGPKHLYLLSVRDRKTGKRYTTPVSLVIKDNQRFLVSPYGEVNWVRNARAVGQVILSRGGRQEAVVLCEMGMAERAPILKRYLAQEPFTRSYFEASPDDPLEAFGKEAARHPVFRLTPVVIC